MAHVGVLLNVTILADTLDSQVCTLNTLVELSVGVVGLIHLGVICICGVVPQSLFICCTVVIRWCISPFNVRVNTVVGQETSAVWVGLTEWYVYRHYLRLGQRVSSEYRRFVESWDAGSIHIARGQTYQRHWEYS